jgi:hypothetical protein
MYGSVSMALLIIFASTAFKLGTNLPILQQVALPPDETAILIHLDGDRGYVETRKAVFTNFSDGIHHTAIGGYESRYHSIELTDSGFRLGGYIHPSGSDTYPNYNFDPSVWAPNSKVEFRVSWYLDANVATWDLCFWDWDKKSPARRVLHLWKEQTNWGDWQTPILFLWQDRLYMVAGKHLATIDISQPREPRILSIVSYSYSGEFFLSFGDNKVVISLPPIPNLPPRRWLDALINRGWRTSICFDGDILCAISWKKDETLTAYRLTKISSDSVTFEKIGHYEPSILENLFGYNSFYDMKLQNGLLYISGAGGGRLVRFNEQISVFDTLGPHSLRLIGHFAAPGAGNVYPLADGRALVAGSHIWLVGPPPRRN